MQCAASTGSPAVSSFFNRLTSPVCCRCRTTAHTRRPSVDGQLDKRRKPHPVCVLGRSLQPQDAAAPARQLLCRQVPGSGGSAAVCASLLAPFWCLLGWANPIGSCDARWANPIGCFPASKELKPSPPLAPVHLLPSPRLPRLPRLPACPSPPAAARLKYLLACGSVVVMPASPWQEFWYHLLRHTENMLVVEQGERAALPCHVWLAGGRAGRRAGGRAGSALWDSPMQSPPEPSSRAICKCCPALRHRMPTACAVSLGSRGHHTAASPPLTRCVCCPASHLSVSLDNRGHHFADVAEELQQDDGLAKHLGEAAAKLVEGSLTPALVQASGPGSGLRGRSSRARQGCTAAGSRGQGQHRSHVGLQHPAERHFRCLVASLPHCLNCPIACRPTGGCCCGDIASCRATPPRCTPTRFHWSKASSCPRRVGWLAGRSASSPLYCFSCFSQNQRVAHDCLHVRVHVHR